MILKSYIVENNINTLDIYNSIIFYGENTGLKDDIKNEIKKKKQGCRSNKFLSRGNNKKKRHSL